MQVEAPVETHPAIEELRGIEVFQDLPRENLEWLAEHMSVANLEPGEISVRPGSPADRMFAILQGQLRAESATHERLVEWGAGHVSGLLPFSRLTIFPIWCGRSARRAWLG